MEYIVVTNSHDARTRVNHNEEARTKIDRVRGAAEESRHVETPNLCHTKMNRSMLIVCRTGTRHELCTSSRSGAPSTGHDCSRGFSCENQVNPCVPPRLSTSSLPLRDRGRVASPTGRRRCTIHLTISVKRMRRLLFLFSPHVSGTAIASHSVSSWLWHALLDVSQC